MKRLFLLLMIITLVAALATPAVAASARKGKKIYKKLCKTCHTKKGEAGKLSPSDKTQRQWRAFFKKDQHKVDPAVWDKLSKKQQKDLRRFFLDFAIDADVAETCG